MSWRLIQTGCHDGFYNMAADEALLKSCISGAASPTVRLYGWRPPAISLGYFQKEEDFQALCESDGLDLVRRMTGGGAIRHDGELTFSMVWRIGEGLMPDGLPESYDTVGEAIIAGLGFLGVKARLRGEKAPLNPVSGPERTAPYLCFEKPSRSDVVSAGGKIAGSAQRRCKNAVLHHGSVPMKKNYGAGSVSVEQMRGVEVDFKDVADALIRGFQQVLGAPLAPGNFSSGERVLIDDLLRGKYMRTKLTSLNREEPDK